MMRNSSKHIIGNVVYRFNELGSTNDLAMSLVSETIAKHGMCILADYQSEGRGQFGREWKGQKNKNIYASIILQPTHLAVNQIHLLHCLTSLAIIDLLDEKGITDSQVKWPNDIFINKKKVAGILIQNILKEKSIKFSVVGIGLNVNQQYFPKELTEATSMYLVRGDIYDVGYLVDGLLLKFDLRYKELESGSAESLVAEYNSRLKNNVVSVRDNHIVRKVKIKNLTLDGKLLCELDDGEISISPNQIINT